MVSEQNFHIEINFYDDQENLCYKHTNQGFSLQLLVYRSMCKTVNKYLN